MQAHSGSKKVGLHANNNNNNNNKQLLDEVEQNIVICQWRADQLLV